MPYDIPNPMSLGFDPDSLDGELREIFNDAIARTIWMGVRCGHLAGPNFDTQCLTAAERFRRNPPSNSEELMAIIDPMTGHFNAECATALFPYVTGEVTLEYRVTEGS